MQPAFPSGFLFNIHGLELNQNCHSFLQMFTCKQQAPHNVIPNKLLKKLNRIINLLADKSAHILYVYLNCVFSHLPGV